MKILLDAMGGDNAPDAVIKGAVKAAKEVEADIILIGDEKIINQKIKEAKSKSQLNYRERNIIKYLGKTFNKVENPFSFIIKLIIFRNIYENIHDLPHNGLHQTLFSIYLDYFLHYFLK